jgi:DNA-directed RNA polymerase sigma subunit (sigma70/sigma32)
MGIPEDFEYTITEISQVQNISKEKCRQILLMAIKKLKNPRYDQLLKEVADSLDELQSKKG